MAFQIPPLPAGQPIADKNGQPTLAFSVYWQQLIAALENQEAIQDQALADIQTALTNAGIALAVANSGLALTQAITESGSNPPPPPSGGGTSDSDVSLASFGSAIHAVVSDELSVTAGAGGIVTLTANGLAVTTEADAPDGVFSVYGKWQWDSTGGGVWVDVGTEDASSPDAEVVDFGGGVYGIDAGSLTVNESKTGLVAASVHKFRFMARNATGGRAMYLSGVVSGVGS